MLRLHTCYIYRDHRRDWRMDPSEVKTNVLIYVSEGTLTYWVNGDTIPLAKGDVLYIPAGSVRGGESKAGNGHQRFATHFTVDGEAGDELRPLLGGKWLKTNVRRADYFQQRFSQLNHHWLMKGDYEATICHAILLEMLVIVRQEHERRQIPPRKEQLVEAIKQYIRHHYSQPITLAELARLIDRSPSYVTNLFKETTGTSPIEYLHHVRVAQAKDMMLTAPAKLIREIAELTGFCDQAYFNRIFKKMTGVTPTRFLTELREYKG